MRGRTEAFRGTHATTRHNGKVISCTVAGSRTKLTSKSSCRQISSAKGVNWIP